jgi:phosphodiesterase/alkaline phosphatase D-like protein
MKTVISLVVIALLSSSAIAQSRRQNQPKSSATAQEQTITNGPVAESISDSAATIGWETASPGDMTIRYGLDREHMDKTATSKQNADGRRHHATIEGLTPETPYYFQVMQGGEAVGKVGTFNTVANGAAPIKSRATIPQ